MEDEKKAYIQIPIDRWEAEILSILLHREEQGIPLKDLISLMKLSSGIEVDEVLRRVSRLSSMELLRSMYRDGEVGYVMHTTFFLLTIQEQIKAIVDELLS